MGLVRGRGFNFFTSPPFNPADIPGAPICMSVRWDDPRHNIGAEMVVKVH